MERARAGILGAAAELVAEGGPRAVTMAAVARRGGVAKATVYNHFRDRNELLLALLASQRAQFLAHCSQLPLGEQLDAAAAWLSASPTIAGIRNHDPATLVRLVESAADDAAVLADVEQWCADGAEARAATRWLISFVVVPARSADTNSMPTEAPD